MKKTALQCAVTLLARREHSQSELFDKLLIRGYDELDITAAINRLLENNYLSDQRFAQIKLDTRLKSGYGWQFIANELQQKGVSVTIIQNLHESCEIDWYLQAELAYNKRFAKNVSADIIADDSLGDYLGGYLDDCLENQTKQKLIEKDKAKKVRFLQSRGFTLEEISTVID